MKKPPPELQLRRRQTSRNQSISPPLWGIRKELSTMAKVKCATCLYSAPKHAPFLCDYVAITGHTRMAQPPEECKYYTPANKRRPYRLAAEEAAGIKRNKEANK